MNTKTNTLIILDSLKYKEREGILKDSLSTYCNAEFYYTYYENNLVKFFHGLAVVGNLLSHLAYWTISFNAACKLFFFRKKLSHKIFINPIVAIFYCFLLNLSRRKEIVVIAGFLFEAKKNKLYFNLRKKFVNVCYKNASSIVVYSKNEISLYSEWFPELANKFVFIKYGRDFDIFEENTYTSIDAYIASGGVSNRDFKTLISAFRVIQKGGSELKCKIATRPQACAEPDKLPNVSVLYDIRIDRFGSFLDKSLFVIIPLANTFLSAGHMALLESMYRKKIILITDIPAVRDYVDENTVFFYNAEDPEDMAIKIKYIYDNINTEAVVRKSLLAHEYYQTDYNFASLLTRIVKYSISS